MLLKGVGEANIYFAYCKKVSVGFKFWSHCASKQNNQLLNITPDEMACLKENYKLDLDSFDFTNERKVMMALSLIPKELKVAFLLRMKEREEQGFLYYVDTKVYFRSLVLDRLSLFAPGNLLATLKVERKVVNNPRIAGHSTKSFAVVPFSEKDITNFVLTECQKHFG